LKTIAKNVHKRLMIVHAHLISFARSGFS